MQTRYPLRRSERIAGRSNPTSGGSTDEGSLTPPLASPVTPTIGDDGVPQAFTVRQGQGAVALVAPPSPGQGRTLRPRPPRAPQASADTPLQAFSMHPDGPHVIADLQAGIKKSKKAQELLKQYPSNLLDREAKTRAFYASQLKRCDALLKECPRRRIWKKMTPCKVFLHRESFIRIVLKKRTQETKKLRDAEIAELRNKLGEERNKRSEVLRHKAKEDPEQAHQKAMAAVAEQKKAVMAEWLEDKQQCEESGLEWPEPESKALLDDSVRSVAPKGRAAPKKMASRLPPSRKSKTAVLGKFTAKTRQRVASEASPEPQRSSAAASSGGNTSPGEAEATEAGKVRNSPMAMSPPPAANKGGSPSGSPVARSPPPSPSVPKSSAPFVEFVGAPVGKGSKVASGMWPWPTEMITRSRAKVL
mmetsp:Transcript_53947/g.96587  ORF Transcript_53947/g.96587 Transcript_53947/m.96587 type:complete len:418 (-) Transcript_53947:43-1296(-)|eukprot:CAMPEP_0197629750 /NCGR_PEP_ID=MMETSP1338-20131121/7482_1 /TAXON_ID=43686 ORGANISM="Pelagodinium beii, Strain RCC1491" /NCGR_SAMPLE_ID=MMETSP1338 /ASSEMBLY_ACC=CAM_ASM_000754 /LENGTH=417 /DNA_ID=CAMNT_0043200843 /DNA_START=64 /DNA_END=1317 /DNA_ORIENTATION=+